MNTVPVAIVVFNRPDLTIRVLERLALVKPKQLYIIADGPRVDVANEVQKCQQVRDLFLELEWDCQVYKNFSEGNLGCRRRVASGLNWVFSQVEAAIILEDDCLPEISFFCFCTELLNRYKADKRIMAISGNNFQFGKQRTSDSYYFSRYPHCWGWATWKRAWQNYDADMTYWPSINSSGWLSDILGDRFAKQYWQHKFQQTYEGKINSWAFVWTFSCWLQSGLCILPNVNLVSNIGFGELGTNHTYWSSPFARMATSPMEFPLKHPSMVVRDAQADAFTQRHQFGRWARGHRKIRAWLQR
ncbi:glycosyltransferase family 2 protein [Leptothoe sp. ISB3NOV94-8A]